MSKFNTKKLVYSGLLVAIGVILPQLFHIIGGLSGAVFLPIHIAVLIAGFVVGPYYAMAVGFLVTALSTLFTGMPALPIAYFMVFELMGYGFFTGFFFEKFKLGKYPSLIAGMLAGRLVYIVAVLFGTYALQLPFGFLTTTAVIDKFLMSWPGIIIQLAVIPSLVFAFEKGGIVDARHKIKE